MSKEQKKLPPDPDEMNNDRALWAGEAINEFVRRTNADEGDELSDLLADLIHWCDRNGQDFNGQLVRARAHYDSETSGEGTQPPPNRVYVQVAGGCVTMVSADDPYAEVFLIDHDNGKESEECKASNDAMEAIADSLPEVQLKNH